MKRRTLAAVAAVLALVLSLAAPAAAHDIVGHNWGLNHVICNGCSIGRGGVVGAWQNVLDGENLLARSAIDGVFGPVTANATRNYQRRAGLTADGIVGPNTWTAGRVRLALWSQNSTYEYWQYHRIAGGGSGQFFRRSKATNTWAFLCFNYEATSHPTIGWSSGECALV